MEGAGDAEASPGRTRSDLELIAIDGRRMTRAEIEVDLRQWRMKFEEAEHRVRGEEENKWT